MDPITRIGIVARTGLTAAAAVLAEIAGWLDARGVTPVFETDTAKLAGVPPGRPVADRRTLPREVDLVLVLGGDGTLLGMAGWTAEAAVDTPILGINFGSLGFLTEVTLPELYPALEATLAGTARIEHRMMLHATVRRGEEVLSDRVVLNDLVVSRGGLSRIITLSVSVDDQFVSRFRADGLIVATPTGSTAYNLAAGGPILHPAADALVLTPIAPHTLTNRPVVLPASAEVRVQALPDRTTNNATAAFDGQSGIDLEAGDVLTVRRADRMIRLVRAPARGYFEILREKLKWGNGSAPSP